MPRSYSFSLSDPENSRAMKSTAFRTTSILLSTLFLIACEQQGDPSADSNTGDADQAVAAIVDGQTIYQSDVEQARNALPPEQRQMPIDFVYDQLLKQLIDRKLVAGEARRTGVSDEEEFKLRLAAAEESLLWDIWLFREIEAQLDDERLQAVYAESLESFESEREIQARHILLESEADAKDVISKLDEGGIFNDLARELSTGPSAPTGGDLGYFVKERMIPEFSKAAFALEVGEYTKAPVQTEFGWHVILVEDSRDTEPPSFEDSRAQLMQNEALKVFGEIVDGLRSKASIEQFDRPAPDSEPEAAPEIEAPDVEDETQPNEEEPAEVVPAEES